MLKGDAVKKESEKRRYQIIGDDECGRHRVLVVMMNGIEGHVIRWTDNCSGCTEYVDGQLYSGPMGCHECGYTGKRRREVWVPIDPADCQKLIEAGR